MRPSISSTRPLDAPMLLASPTFSAAPIVVLVFHPDKYQENALQDRACTGSRKHERQRRQAKLSNNVLYSLESDQEKAVGVVL